MSHVIPGGLQCIQKARSAILQSLIDYPHTASF